jgi:hypothetical protein
MYLLQAHSLFCQRAVRSLPGIDLRLGDADAWMLAATAAASLSGQLDDCLTDHDLDDAVAEFLVLFREGVVTADQLDAEMGRVVLLLLEWSEEHRRSSADVCVLN